MPSCICPQSHNVPHEELHCEDLHISWRYRLENLMDDDPSKNAAEISRILLWMAIRHPEILNNKKYIHDLYVYYLYFPESWEHPDEFIPTVPLTRLLQCKVCKDLQSLSGYYDPIVLRSISNPMYTKRIAIGKDTDVRLLMAELERRRHRDFHKYQEDIFEGTSIHLRCGEINIKDLAPIPDIHPYLFISDVSDYGVDWVVKATAVLLPKLKTALCDRTYPFLGILHLPRSTLTLAGIEAIAKGFFNSRQHFDLLDVSSSYISLSNRRKKSFTWRVTKKYNLGVLTFSGEKEMQFTEILDDMSRQVTLQYEGTDDTKTFFDTTEKDGLPLGSVLSPVWVEEHIPANLKGLVLNQREILELMFC